MKMVRMPRLVRYAVFLVLCSLLVTMAPPAPTYAGLLRDLALDDTLDQFARGTMQRTGLAQVDPIVSGDNKGGVQLGKIGVLSGWLPPTPGRSTLMEDTLNMGYASLEGFGTSSTPYSRIYIIGGQTRAATRTDHVWSILVDRQTGSLIGNTQGDWDSEPSLPAVVGSTESGRTQPQSVVVQPAVTAVTTSDGAHYIYVIGGQTAVGLISYSSFATRLGTIDGNGRITGWQELTNARIVPDFNNQVPPDVNGVGREAAKALSVTINGRTFIYVLGGLQRYGTSLNPSRTALFAEVGPGGKLYKPSTNRATEGWEALDPIPVVPPNPRPATWGLFESAATVDYYPTYSSYAIFMFGGRTTDSTTDNFVYRARIIDGSKPEDSGAPIGSLTWLDRVPASGSPAANYTLPERRSAHGSVAFAGNFYLTGGIPEGDNGPDESGSTGVVQTSYVDDDPPYSDSNPPLQLPSASGGSNFNKSKPLYRPRAYHATVLVRGAGTSNAGAFVYVLGGRGNAGDINDNSNGGPVNNIVVGRIGLDEDAAKGFALDGWYYSKPATLFSTSATLQEVSWATGIDRAAGNANADIQVDYRTSLDADCDRPSWDDSDWVALDGSADGFRSINGLNKVTGLTINSRCFQYRAKLVSGSTAIPASYSPKLGKFAVKIIVPGDIDLWPKTPVARLNARQQLTYLDVQIANQNITNPSDPTLDADSESGGSFFVDMFIYGPSSTAPNPPNPVIPVNLATNPNDKAYANINKASMPAGIVRSVTSWCAQDNAAKCTPIDPLSFFKNAGWYTVIIVVDAENGVKEAATGEGNNIQRVTFRSTGQAYELSLPAVRR